jgi:hypothetical protein
MSPDPRSNRPVPQPARRRLKNVCSTSTADEYQAAMAEHREFGGTLKFHENSNNKAKKAFQEIAELFPADWISASSEHRALLATATVVRAHYADTHLRKGVEQRTEWNALTPEQESRVNEPDPGGKWIKTDRTGSSGRRNPETGVWESTTFPVYERAQFEVRPAKPTLPVAPRSAVRSSAQCSSQLRSCRSRRPS